ncbi:MAG: peptidyl-prolyl cis-trans isomerase [Deltaproteobacteria bacterium]|nr:peptidyl-prolyl cis-trans isomerase [Deltaproteobacteria bacterium]
MVKPGRFAAAGAALAAFAFAALFGSCSREPRNPPDAAVVVAEVDNVPVLLREVKSEILASRGYSTTLEERGADRAEVSEAVRLRIERSIVLREGARRGITVSFASLEEEVVRYRTDFPVGGLEKALLQVGMSEEEWRERLRESILYRKSAEAIASSLVTVTPREVEEAYLKEGKTADRPERIRVRQFLFGSAEPAVDSRERLLREGVPGGGDSAGKGVDLGFFSREELPPELPPGLFEMKVGEVSEPVFLEDSVSLFRVEEREPARAQTLETEERRIRESLLSERREAAFRRWLAIAYMNATVKVRAELLEKLFEGKR